MFYQRTRRFLSHWRAGVGVVGRRSVSNIQYRITTKRHPAANRSKKTRGNRPQTRAAPFVRAGMPLARFPTRTTPPTAPRTPRRLRAKGGRCQPPKLEAEPRAYRPEQRAPHAFGGGCHASSCFGWPRGAAWLLFDIGYWILTSGPPPQHRRANATKIGAFAGISGSRSRSCLGSTGGQGELKAQRDIIPFTWLNRALGSLSHSEALFLRH